MAVYYNCKDGEMLDAICKSYYGYSRGSVEEVLAHELNREIAKKMPILQSGDVVYLPDIVRQATTTTTLSIWG